MSTNILVLAFILALAAPACTQSQDDIDHNSTNSDRPLPKLFDFDYFKQLFGKQYATWSEELARRRLFFARALGAFVSGMRYKFRLSPNYNAVNSGSDATPEERAQMRNRLMAQRSRSKKSYIAAPARDVPLKFVPSEREDVEKEVRQYLDEHADQLGLNRAARAKRDLTLDRVGPRKFSLDQLIKRPEVQQIPRMSTPVQSNNPNYAPVEVASYGLSDQMKEVKMVHVARAPQGTIASQLTKSLYEVGKMPKHIRFKEEDMEDKMFVDHRDCMNPPRAQGNCGACYAFAAISIMEWMYCNKTGKEGVEFSEQYMIDCGKGRFPDPAAENHQGMNGCDGAVDEYLPTFIRNFGLELRKNYPYMAQDGQCPYDEEFDLKRTGYIRMKGLDTMSSIPREHFHHFVEYAPIYVGFNTGPHFDDYGGGLVESNDCGADTDHAMVLLGFGRLDGREYLLVRNSYGVNWGEEGYMKVALDSVDKCFEDVGSSFGTSNGVDYNLKPVKTRKADEKDSSELNRGRSAPKTNSGPQAVDNNVFKILVKGGKYYFS